MPCGIILSTCDGSMDPQTPTLSNTHHGPPCTLLSLGRISPWVVVATGHAHQHPPDTRLYPPKLTNSPSYLRATLFRAYSYIIYVDDAGYGTSMTSRIHGGARLFAPRVCETGYEPCLKPAKPSRGPAGTMPEASKPPERPSGPSGNHA